MTKIVSLNGVSIELGFGALPDIKALNKIINLSQNKALPIYFDNKINGSETSHGLEVIEDEWGIVQIVLVNGECTFFDIGRKLVTPLDIFYDDQFKVSQFSHDDKEYYSADGSGCVFMPVRIHFSNFYCLNSELAKVKEKLNLASTSSVKPEAVRDISTKPTSGQLFTNPPKRHSPIFEKFTQAVDIYIERTWELPNREQLWGELMNEDSDGKNKKSISGISKTAMDRDNFLKNYSRYILLTGQEQDK